MALRERRQATKPILFKTDQAVSLILPLLKEYTTILITYLFGSRITARDNHDSDMDIALFTTNDFSWENYYILYGQLSKKLHSDRLDLAWLNKAEPILCFEIIRNSRILFYRDGDIVNDFESKAKKNFYDYSFYLKRHKEYGHDVLQKRESP